MEKNLNWNISIKYTKILICRIRSVKKKNIHSFLEEKEVQARVWRAIKWTVIGWFKPAGNPRMSNILLYLFFFFFFFCFLLVIFFFFFYILYKKRSKEPAGRWIYTHRATTETARLISSSCAFELHATSFAKSSFHQVYHHQLYIAINKKIN